MQYIADAGPAIHISPAPILHLGWLTVTNSMFYGWICVALMIVVFVAVARHATVKPRRGLTQIVEAGVEFIQHTVESGFEDKSRARKYVPFFVTLFFFVLFNNWLGLLPGVGEAVTAGGVPLLRPFTADLNGTLAAGVVTMLFVYVSSVREFGGIKKYLRHFFIGNPLHPFYFSIGLLEMVTDLTRVISLSLRLFLNITIGEIIIAVFSYLGHDAAPLLVTPFTLLELFVGALQAYIFTILSIMYLAVATNEATHTQKEALTEATEPETINLKRIRGDSHA